MLRFDADEQSETSSDDEPDPAKGWIISKKYSYLVNPTQPNMDFLGTVLQKLQCSRAFDIPVSMNPDKGQLVVIRQRAYTLLLCLRFGRNFRVIIRDEDSTTNFTAMAKDVTEVIQISGKSHDKAISERTQVLLFLFTHALAQSHFCFSF